MSITCGSIASRSRADNRVKSSMVLFSTGKRVDIQWSMSISKVPALDASCRASVDFPAAILPQRRYKVVGRGVSIVTDYHPAVLTGTPGAAPRLSGRPPRGWTDRGPAAAGEPLNIMATAILRAYLGGAWAAGGRFSPEILGVAIIPDQPLMF